MINLIDGLYHSMG